MNIRALMDWGIVTKHFKTGERKDFFLADKDIWEVARKIIKERSKREIEPVIKVLNELKDVKGNETEIKQFKKTVTDLESFTSKLSSVVDKFVKSDEHWFYKNLMKMVK